MVTDRRGFIRLASDLDALIFLENKEIQAKVVNISEQGICFHVPIFYNLIFERNDKFAFCFVDRIRVGNSDVLSIIRQNAYVKHTEYTEDKFSIGCFVQGSKELTKYITYKYIKEYCCLNVLSA